MVIQDNVPGLGKHTLRYLQVRCHEICNLLLDGLAKENVVGEGEARREHAGTSEVRQQLLNLNEGYIRRCSRNFLSKFTVGF